MRTDLAARTVEGSVTAFVAASRAIPPLFRARGGAAAAWLGSAMHARHQRACADSDPTYRAEVALARTGTFAGFTLRLRGRCDGLYRTGDGQWWIEELKSGRVRPEPGSETAAAFSFQALLYAWMAEDVLGAPVRARWVWLPFDRGPAVPTPIPADAAAFERRVARVVRDVAAAAKRHEAVLRERRERAASVTFPFPRRRPGQAEIETAVERALEHGEHLLLEAPTGLGKTAAVLTPVLRHVLAHDRRAFVASASTLQQRGASNTLRALAPGRLTTAVQLRAKARMCAIGTLTCHPQLCDRAAGHARRRESSGVVAACLAEGPVVRPETIFGHGERTGCCPFELSLDAAEETPLTLGDINYAFDPVVRLPRWSDPALLGDAILVVDEAHQLPARVRAALSVALGARDARDAAERAALGSHPLHRRQRELAESLASWIQREAGTALGDATGCTQHAPDAEAADALWADFDATAAETLDDLAGSPAEGPAAAFLDLAWQTARFRHDAPGVYAEVVACDEAGTRLERWCLDAAPALLPTFAATHATIAMSATLAPPEAHARLLGLDPDRVRTLRVPGAAPEDRLRVVIDPRFSTRRAHRKRDDVAIARSLTAVLDVLPGNALIGASSHAQVERLARNLTPRRHRILQQRPGQGEAERNALLGELRGATDRVLVAIAGGALAEGVDTAGLGLAMVAVVGPCLPALDDETRLRIAHHEEIGDDGFDLVLAMPGMTRVIQTVGRLLRHEDDRGLVLLLGDRFLRAPHRDALPETWTAGGAPEDLVDDPVEAARRFFGAGG